MSTIPVARIWEDADGVSHFADDFVALDAAGDIGSLSRRFAASGLVFRQTPGTYNFDWHCAPRRQFICNLDADVEVRNTLLQLNTPCSLPCVHSHPFMLHH